MTRSLPPNPSLKFLKSEAKSLLKSLQHGESPESSGLSPATPTAIKLQDAQFGLARDYGFSSWTALKKFVEGKENMKNSMGKLVMPPYNTTLMGVIKGLADYYQINLSPGMLYGLSCHAFVINIHKDLCPCGPYAWKRDRFLELVKNLGIASDCLGFFTETSSREERLALESKLRAAIDNGRVCSFCNMEHQLIRGYDSEGFLLVKPWPDGCCGEDITPGRLTYESWREFRSVHVGFMIHDKAVPVAEKTALVESLRYAVEMFAQKNGGGDYAMGQAAYSNWIAAIHRAGDTHGNWWNAMVWSECRKMAGEFLVEVAEKYPVVSDECVAAASIYRNIAENLYKVGDKQKDSREKQQWLEAAAEEERCAVEMLNKVLIKVSP